MKLFQSRGLTAFNVVAISSAAVFLLAGANRTTGDRTFSDKTVDVGIVVSDLDRSLKFYTEVIGLTRTSEFAVDKDFCTEAGLTDGHALSIQVLAPNGDTEGTGIKLMALKGVDSQQADHSFVHSTLGFSYLTFHVSDIGAASARMKAAGVKPVAGEQVRVPLQTPVPIFLTVVADPDGNLIELLGPKASK